MGSIRLFSLLFWVLCLVACAPLPPAPDEEVNALLHDSWVPAPLEPAGVDEVLRISPAMVRYLDEDLAPLIARHGAIEALRRALFRRDLLQLQYDASHTLNAAQAFEARAGNCLSLVLMSAAIARHLGLPLTFQQVEDASSWSQQGGLLVRSGHVNLLLGPRSSDTVRQTGRVISTHSGAVVVDFLPSPDGVQRPARPISEATVRAMYMNNRAAEALVGGQPAEAYRWVRAALHHDPLLPAAHNTLALVYQHAGRPDDAHQVFAQMLQRWPQHTHALANWAGLLQQQGRYEQAAALRQRLAAVEEEAPFFALNQAQSALARGDLSTAQHWLERQLRQGEDAETLFWLAQLRWRQGQLSATRQALEQAQQQATTAQRRALYAAKLAWLNAQSAPQNP